MLITVTLQNGGGGILVRTFTVIVFAVTTAPPTTTIPDTTTPEPTTTVPVTTIPDTTTPSPTTTIPDTTVPDTTTPSPTTTAPPTTHTPPTIDPLPSQSILQGSSLQIIALTGIAADEISDVISVTASSNNPGLIFPSVTYTSPSTTGNITYTPSPCGVGTAVITVTVNDNDGGITTRGFTVNVFPTVSNPTLLPIPDPTPIPENSGLQSIVLKGISGGCDPAQFLFITSSSNDTTIIPNPTIVYVSPTSTGTLSYTPVTNAFGTAEVTVTVFGSDGSSITRTFNVVVFPASADDNHDMRDILMNNALSDVSEASTITFVSVCIVTLIVYVFIMML